MLAIFWQVVAGGSGAAMVKVNARELQSEIIKAVFTASVQILMKTDKWKTVTDPDVPGGSEVAMVKVWSRAETKFHKWCNRQLTCLQRQRRKKHKHKHKHKYRHKHKHKHKHKDKHKYKDKDKE